MTAPQETDMPKPPCDHDWEYVGSAGDFGQEFNVYRCKKCGKDEYDEVAQ